MDVQSYTEFSAEFHQRVLTRRIPIDGAIEVTRRCPLSCAHCYNNLPMGDKDARHSELTYEEHCRILDEITEAGCLWLLYTGGEPFAREDFLNIYTYAKQKGLLITLFTNGTLITEKTADYLVEWRPFSIEITLYGRTKDTYERVTRVPGSYERCMRGIGLLLERGLPLKLKTVAMTLNKHELGEMKRFVEDLGLPFKLDAMINPRIDRSQSPLVVRLRPEEIVKLDLQDPKRVAEWRRFSDKYIDATALIEQGRDVYECGGGLDSFAIDPYGRMSTCVLSQVDTYDLRRGSFQEGWEDYLLKVRRKKITMMTKCAACELKAMCGMCPANGELENGHPEKPVDFLCQVAHLRAYVLDFPVSLHGECEYCQGGGGYEKLMQSARALRNGRSAEGMTLLAPGEQTTSSNRSCVSAGCSTCSAMNSDRESHAFV